MAKSVIITFTRDGAIVQNLCSAVGIRQGDGAGEVTFKAVFAGRRNDEYVAKLHFQRPDGKTVQNVVMSPSSTDPNAFVATANTSWYFAVPGTARASVTITSTGGTIAAQGSYSFNVEATEVEVADSTLTYDEAAALEGLIADLDDRTLKRGTVLTLSSQATAEDFYDAILSYYSTNEIEPKDGDRFVAQSIHMYVGAQKPVLFSGEYRNTKDVLITEYTHAGATGDVDIAYLHIAYQNGTTPTVRQIAMKSYVDSFFDENGNALKAYADANGDEISSTYAKKAGDNVFIGNNIYTGIESHNGHDSFSNTVTFNDGAYARYKTDMKVTIGPASSQLAVYSFPYSGSENGRAGTYTIATTAHISDAFSEFLNSNNSFRGDNSHQGVETFHGKVIMTNGLNVTGGISSTAKATIVITLGPANGFHTYYSFPYDWQDGSEHKEEYLTLATTSQVALAKSQAIASANATTQQKIDALMEAMDFSNGAFGIINAETLNVTHMTVSEIETRMASLEDQYFEMLAGNTHPYGSQFVGTVYTKYDGTHDFFVGINNNTLLLGDVTTTRDGDGKILSISPIGLKPLAVRDSTEAFSSSEEHVVKAVHENGSITFKDAGFSATEVMSVLGQESDRRIAEQGRIAAENVRSALEVTRERILPFPITTAEYNHLKDDGYYYNVYSDGTYDVTEEADEDAVRSYQYQNNALYPITDDPTIAAALATISEAADLVNSLVFVTAEQWAEYYRLGTLDPDKRYVLDDEEHMKTLCVDIPAAEAERQAFETYRIEHEGYGITRAQLATLNANGVFGVHFATVDGKLTTVMSVYASRALAEAANEEYVFPMQQGVTYALLD